MFENKHALKCCIYIKVYSNGTSIMNRTVCVSMPVSNYLPFFANLCICRRGEQWECKLLQCLCFKFFRRSSYSAGLWKDFCPADVCRSRFFFIFYFLFLLYFPCLVFSVFLRNSRPVGFVVRLLFIVTGDAVIKFFVHLHMRDGGERNVRCLVFGHVASVTSGHCTRLQAESPCTCDSWHWRMNAWIPGPHKYIHTLCATFGKFGIAEVRSASSRVQRPTKSPIKLASLAAISRLCLFVASKWNCAEKCRGWKQKTKLDTWPFLPSAICLLNACGVSLKFHQRRKMKMEHNKLRSVWRNTPVLPTPRGQGYIQDTGDIHKWRSEGRKVCWYCHYMLGGYFCGVTKANVLLTVRVLETPETWKGWPTLSVDPGNRNGQKTKDLFARRDNSCLWPQGVRPSSFAVLPTRLPPNWFV